MNDVMSVKAPLTISVYNSKQKYIIKFTCSGDVLTT